MTAMLTSFDLHLLGEGTHFEAFNKLGARIIEHNGVSGVYFAVWAPNARGITVVGDFNSWNGAAHPMRPIEQSGYWDAFVPGIGKGAIYKFEIVGADGRKVLKSDPCGRYFEIPPLTASIVWDGGGHEWQDEAWMAARLRPSRSGEAGADRWLTKPMSVYEVHLGSWQRTPDGRVHSYRELADRLVNYVKDMGFTHVEMLPVMEHPYTGSWGYQVTGFFAPTSRFGTPEDFKFLVDAFHQAGIGVILDWVPGHFPKDQHGLARFDGTALYEHSDRRQGEHEEWGTLVFNYGRHEVRSFLLSNALFWLKEFHIDGLRVDAVASMLYLDYSRKEGEWVPNQHGGRENLDAIEFIKQLNMLIAHDCPGTFISAEESTSWPGVTRPVHLGGLGFTYKWNMGWMHDMLDYTKEDPVHRKWHHNKITFSMMYAYSEHFMLPFSHDEVVHGKRSMLDKMPGDVWQKHAGLRALYGYMFVHPGKKLLFMGGEIGQWREWNHDWQLDWEILGDPMHAGLQRWVRDLNRVYREQPSLFDADFDHGGFSWIDCNDHDHSIIALMRQTVRPSGSPAFAEARAGKQAVGQSGASQALTPSSPQALDRPELTVAIVNFTPVPRRGYRLGVPQSGAYQELLNSDADVYGGSNLGNDGEVIAEAQPSHGHEYSLSLTVPPLGFLILKPNK
ncbi:MAG TPA: 1,4-alpha-glucan branching protein GlgB [Vicinamibacterales bacterium]|nr:1,4-alpha-glucan branching protein GlgB [Vicinamibacterales bacterium]